jgi:hypothetical protein
MLTHFPTLTIVDCLMQVKLKYSIIYCRCHIGHNFFNTAQILRPVFLPACNLKIHGCCILQFFEHFASKQTLHLEWLYLEEWFYQFWYNMLLALSSSPVVYLEAVACERVSNILHIYYCFLHLFAVLEYIGHRNWERHNVNLKYLTTLMIIRWDYFYNYRVLGT